MLNPDRDRGEAPGNRLDREIGNFKSHGEGQQWEAGDVIADLFRFNGALDRSIRAHVRWSVERIADERLFNPLLLRVGGAVGVVIAAIRDESDSRNGG